MTKKLIRATFIAVPLLVIVVAFLALPSIVRRVAIDKIESATGRRTEIGQVSLNPFTLTAKVDRLRLSEKGSNATFFSMSSARVVVSPLSLPKRALIVSQMQVVSPYLHVERTAPNSFNFSDLVTPKKKTKEEKQLLFSLNNIVLTKGSLDFRDAALAAPKTHTIRKLSLSIPFISNIPYLADRYVTPRLSCSVNDSPFSVQGKLKPYAKAVEATVALNLKDVDLPFYLGYLPFPLPVQVRSGRFSTSLEVGYLVTTQEKPDLRLAGAMALDRLTLNEPAGAPLLSWKGVETRIDRASMAANRLDLSLFAIESPVLYASRDRKGIWNFQKLFHPASTPKSETGQPRAKKEETAPFNLKLARLSLKGGVVHLTDGVPAGGFRTDLRGIEIGMENFATTAAFAPFSVQLATSKGEKAACKGELSAKPLAARGALSIKGVNLNEYYPYLTDTLAAPVHGTIGASADLRYSATDGVAVEKGALSAENLAASFGEGEGIRIKRLLVNGIAANQKRNRAQIKEVKVEGGGVTISRAADGTVSAQRLLKKKPTATVAVKRKAAVGHKSHPFSCQIGTISGSGLDLKFTDRGRKGAPSFVLHRIGFSLARIAVPVQGTIPFRLAAGYRDKGSLGASGNFTPSPTRIVGKLQLRRIPLRDFDAYLPEQTSIFLADGAVDTDLSVNLLQGPEGFTGSFGGSLGVRSFYCIDTVLSEDLLKWENLQLDQVNGRLSPFALSVKEVSLNNFYSRVIIDKDATLNFQHLWKEQVPQRQSGTPQQTVTKRGPTKAVTTVTTQTAPHAAVSPTREIRIDTVTMQGGTINFSDRHLSENFNTTFYNLGGRVSGLSSRENTLADVDLRGNLENHSPLAIVGKLNPLRSDPFLDLKISFTDIELSPLTPYSDTYLGYAVDKGKLFLDLTYRVEKKSLKSENKVFIDQFTFGKSSDSKQATKLPIRLAVALLKDRKGEIHLDLPVAGQTDDPQFNVWHVVFQMLKNLMVKAATSPFALLQSLFGGEQDISAVAFTPGSATLAAAEEAKLQKLAQVLLDRPALHLEISGYVDKETDPEGYRNEVMLRKMRAEKLQDLARAGHGLEGQALEKTHIEPNEYSTYLTRVYKKEKFPKPRNMLGLLKTLPDEEMKKLILANTVVTAREMQALARERAEAVRAYLQTQGKLPPERIFDKTVDIYSPSPKEKVSKSRVEFGVSTK